MAYIHFISTFTVPSQSLSPRQHFTSYITDSIACSLGLNTRWEMPGIIQCSTRNPMKISGSPLVWMHLRATLCRKRQLSEQRLFVCTWPEVLGSFSKQHRNLTRSYSQGSGDHGESGELSALIAARLAARGAEGTRV